ncbi:PqqD family protein, partial [bacterium]|nr:PqqD family protein [bacterium]
MMIDLDTIVVANGECPVREVGPGLVIMDPAGTATHSLDEVGTFLWRRLDGRHSLGQVIEALVAEYDVEPARAAADVQDFLAQLLAADP